MGKPIGNGYPVAVVATRREIANCLGGEVGYFNTVIKIYIYIKTIIKKINFFILVWRKSRSLCCYIRSIKCNKKRKFT